MNELQEDLDRALRAVTFSEAPVKRARQAGRRIRTRRRVALLAGALAVAAVAAAYPALSRNSAAPAAPATGTKTPAPHRGPYHGDPVITDGLPGGTTQAADGLTSASGVIANGAVGAAPWQVIVDGPAATNPVPADPCFNVTIGSVGNLVLSCTDFPPPKAGGLNSGDPVIFTGLSNTVTEATVGEAAPVVTYVIVTFTDGQQLKLVPVTVHGHRYIAWVAPLTMTVAGVAAHLGGPYSDSGQTATAVPFNPSGQMPVFGQWQRQGQPVPARASGIIGGGLVGDHVWSAIGYVGPWGSCTVVNGEGFDCVPFGPARTVAILGPVTSSVPGLQVILGSAPAGVAKVRVTLAGGQAVTARPVAVGNYRLFAVAVTANAAPTGWTTYDAAGQQTGTAPIASASTKGAKP